MLRRQGCDVFLDAQSGRAAEAGNRRAGSYWLGNDAARDSRIYMLERTGTLHQHVRREGIVQNFAGGFDSRYGKRRGIEQTELDQDRGLIPIDMFVSQLVAPETNDGNQGDFHAF